MKTGLNDLTLKVMVNKSHTYYMRTLNKSFKADGLKNYLYRPSHLPHSIQSILQRLSLQHYNDNTYSVKLDFILGQRSLCDWKITARRARKTLLQWGNWLVCCTGCLELKVRVLSRAMYFSFFWKKFVQHTALQSLSSSIF